LEGLTSEYIYQEFGGIYLEEEHPNGIKYRHPVNKVVAWKTQA